MVDTRRTQRSRAITPDGQVHTVNSESSHSTLPEVNRPAILGLRPPGEEEADNEPRRLPHRVEAALGQPLTHAAQPPIPGVVPAHQLIQALQPQRVEILPEPLPVQPLQPSGLRVDPPYHQVQPQQPPPSRNHLLPQQLQGQFLVPENPMTRLQPYYGYDDLGQIQPSVQPQQYPYFVSQPYAMYNDQGFPTWYQPQVPYHNPQVQPQVQPYDPAYYPLPTFPTQAEHYITQLNNPPPVGHMQFEPQQVPQGFPITQPWQSGGNALSRPTGRNQPLVDALRLAPIPLGFKGPTNIPTYMGDSDPFEWVRKFEAAMTLHGETDLLMCRTFPTLLGGRALAWYMSLPSGSISSWNSLATSFQTQFATSRPVPKTIHTLERIRQQAG